MPLSNSGKRYEDLFLVDTGAIDCLAPRRKLLKAGIKLEGRQVYGLANGRAIEHDFGFSRLNFMGAETVAPIIMGPDDAEPLLGAVALESAGISVDPATRALRKMPAKPLKSQGVAQGSGVAAPLARHTGQRRPNWLAQLLLIALLAGLPRIAVGQDYDLGWFVIAGGGGVSAGGDYALSGTVGQPTPGPLTGGDYSLTGGFWAMASERPTPGPPRLSVSLSGTQVVISWPADAAGFVLQTTTALEPPVSWSPALETPVTVGDRQTVTVPVTGVTRFYRLRSP